MKSPTTFYGDTKSIAYSVSEKDYDDERKVQVNCDTPEDYGMDVQEGNSPPYLCDDHHHIRGVISNVHLVHAKTEKLTYERHQMEMKPSPLVLDSLVMQQDTNNNNNSESYLNLVPPPPHLAAELGRKCMSFNAEQVNNSAQGLVDEGGRGSEGEII